MMKLFPMADFFIKHNKLILFLLGSISVLGFAPHYQVWASTIGFSGLMWYLLHSDSRKKSFYIAYIFAFAHFAFGFSWIGNALLVDIGRFGWLYPITLLACGLFFGLFFALPALLLSPRQTGWRKWLSFCCLTILFEWVRSFIFTGFPWNLLGYTLAFSDSLIQTAAFGGTYLLSLISLCFYSVWGLVLSGYTFKKFAITVVTSIIIFSAMYYGGQYRLQNAKQTSTDILIRIVQPSIPQTMKWNRAMMEANFDDYLSLSAKQTATKPDIIVWGETASPFLLDESFEHMQKVSDMLPPDAHLITGQISYHPKDGTFKPHNSMLVINSQGQVIDYYHKSHLVPFGEYIPLRQYLPSFLRPIANTIGTFGQGDGPKLIKAKGLPDFGAIICYEAIFPHQIVDEQNRPNFLFNLTNDGWYGDSSGPYQHFVATKLRAVEEGITIIRAANNGISGQITAYGQEKGTLPLNFKGVSDTFLQSSLSEPTPYAKSGNKIFITFCLILLLLTVIKVEYINR